MKKIIYPFFLSLIFVSAVNAQQQFQLSQYFVTPVTINPATTGIDDFMDVKVGFRQQWAGFDDAPKTYFMSVSGSLHSKNSDFPYSSNSLRISNPSAYGQFSGQGLGKIKHGLGGYVVRDEQGPFKQMGGYISYAPHFAFRNNAVLALGIAAGISNREWNIGDISVREPGDDTYDNYLSQGVIKNYFDMNAGLMFYTPSFYIGYSANQILQNQVYQEDINVGKLALHHYLMAGYKVTLSPNLDLLPSLLIKYVDPAPATLDINLKVRYNEMFWAGVSYRNKDAIVGMAGLMLNNFLNLSYSFDFTTSDLNAYNNGSHELVLGLMLFNKNGSTPYLW